MITSSEHLKISVIIPTYNRIQLLSRALDSLVCQTYKDFDVWVSDDSSSEDLEGLVKNYKRKLEIYFIKNNRFGGPAVPRNNAIIASKSSFLAFLDSDDYWHPKKLAESIKFLSQGVDFVYHDLFKVSKGKKLYGTFFNEKLVYAYPMNSKNMSRVTAQLGNSIPTSSVVVSRHLLEAVGLFEADSNSIAIEDAKAWIKISRLQPSVKKLSRVLGYYEIGSDNISSFEDKEKQLFRSAELYKYIQKTCPEHKKYTYFFAYKYALCLASLKRYDSSNDVLARLQITPSMQPPIIKITCQILILFFANSVRSLYYRIMQIR